MQRAYHDELNSDLRALARVVNLHQVCSRMANYEQFLDERPVLRLASDYVRKGYQVELIAEAKQSRRDFFVIPSSGPRCTFEVKHISGRNTLHAMFDEIRGTVSPYVVKVHTQKFQLVTQAKQLAETIKQAIEALKTNSLQPNFETLFTRDLGFRRVASLRPSLFTTRRGSGPFSGRSGVASCLRLGTKGQNRFADADIFMSTPRNRAFSAIPQRFGRFGTVPGLSR